jgi:hypothetical protein
MFVRSKAFLSSVMQHSSLLGSFLSYEENGVFCIWSYGEISYYISRSSCKLDHLSPGGKNSVQLWNGLAYKKSGFIYSKKV